MLPSNFKSDPLQVRQPGRYSNTLTTTTQHELETRHSISFASTIIIAKMDNFWPRIIRKLIELILDRSTVNGECGYQLGKSWQALGRLLACGFGDTSYGP